MGIPKDIKADFPSLYRFIEWKTCKDKEGETDGYFVPYVKVKEHCIDKQRIVKIYCQCTACRYNNKGKCTLKSILINEKGCTHFWRKNVRQDNRLRNIEEVS